MEQGIRIRTVSLLCFIMVMWMPQMLSAQLNPINNLQFNQWYVTPNNYFRLSWEQPDSTLDTLIGYNIYREADLYRFQIETTLYNTPSGSNCGNDFLAYNGYPFWIHVTAVYNTTQQESPYIDSAYSEGFLIGITEHYIGKIKSYPNPFTTTTTIEYELAEPSHVQLTIYNAIGELVYQIEDHLEQGNHKVTWSPGHLPRGMYHAVLRSEEGVSVIKMIKR